ncbi:hypothetical protein FKM82_021795 [Ascaphus truei]
MKPSNPRGVKTAVIPVPMFEVSAVRLLATPSLPEALETRCWAMRCLLPPRSKEVRIHGTLLLVNSHFEACVSRCSLLFFPQSFYLALIYTGVKCMKRVISLF